MMDLLAEDKAKGTAFRQHKQRVFKASYTNHYRAGLIELIDALELRSHNTVHSPVLDALALPGGDEQRHPVLRPGRGRAHWRGGAPGADRAALPGRQARAPGLASPSSGWWRPGPGWKGSMTCLPGTSTRGLAGSPGHGVRRGVPGWWGGGMAQYAAGWCWVVLGPARK